MREAEHRYCDFSCGWGAGCVETIVLYPTYKVIFRQQLHGINVAKAISQVRSEGVSMLYRGLLPPLIMRTSSRALMFGLYDEFLRVLSCSSGGSSLSFCHAKAAMCAGVCEALLCPLERVQVLLQNSAYHSQFRNTSEALRAVRPHGLPEFYRGMSVVVARNALSNALFFTLREPFREEVINLVPLLPLNVPPTIRPFVADFISGGLLGASISTIFFPLNVVKSRMQSRLGSSFENAFLVLGVVWRERNASLLELFRGVHLNFSRSLLAWGLTNSVYELFRRWLDCK